MGIALNQEEKRQLEAIAQNGNQSWIRRARVILLDESDLPTADISQEVGLSSDRVRYWIREFKKRKMDITLSSWGKGVFRDSKISFWGVFLKKFSTWQRMYLFYS